MIHSRIEDMFLGTQPTRPLKITGLQEYCSFMLKISDLKQKDNLLMQPCKQI
jgi:hypothetical protein